jgi:hypothetical protein
MKGPNSVVNSYIPVVAPRESVPVALALYNSVGWEGNCSTSGCMCISTRPTAWTLLTNALCLQQGRNRGACGVAEAYNPVVPKPLVFSKLLLLLVQFTCVCGFVMISLCPVA